MSLLCGNDNCRGNAMETVRVSGVERKRKRREGTAWIEWLKNRIGEGRKRSRDDHVLRSKIASSEDSAHVGAIGLTLEPLAW